MGIRLIVEVLDHWQDAGLTPGERWDLLVLAENANDGSRLTFGPVHAQHILDRANKSPKGWRNAITALMRKKVITTHLPGRINQFAVYHLEHLCPEAPHDGNKGQCTRPPKDQKEGHPPGDPVPTEGHPADDPEGHPTDDPLTQEGHPADAKRVIQEVTPTPLVSSFKDSPLTTPSSPVAEDSTETSVMPTDAEEGGGGGEIESSEDQEQDKPLARAEAFVDSLDYRGKRLQKSQRAKLAARVAAAFKDGWTENGLRRYLDISDDPSVRTPAGVYAHRLSEDELPPAADSSTLPPVCDQHTPAAATDVSLRVHPITGDPCPRCHPSSIGQATAESVPACAACLEENPAADRNIRLRYRVVDDVHQACPDCHPKRIVILKAQQAARDTADGGMWERAAARAASRTLTGTDARVQGWLDLSHQLAAEEQAAQKPATSDQRAQQAIEAGRRIQRQADGPKPMVASSGWSGPFKCPEDQSVYDEPFWPKEDQ
ncbi:hypothetical protein [Streptomyces sp. NBC_01092]|uniref:hypothetical protein n=1 Tax=Streptomyces sp. NBC_01092 TaxID=2903748 RepID=UPI0038650392|nr:hypothetical protein OG254_12515 [Streptomyces sp. NBC_01092]